MTENENLVLEAIKNEFDTIHHITKHTKINKHTVAQVLAGLSNRGVITLKERGQWELIRCVE